MCAVVVVGVACSFTKLQHGGLLLMLMSAGETGELEFLSSELRSCVKVEVDVLGSPSLNSLYGLCRHKARLNER